ncbi:MAG: hypothetical protein ACQEXM_27585 [Actinomycetota bacterium]|uniref:hypothetical protein n=1 Tax=Pseudonocardia alni TaxID=33907 RepID=UPI0033EC708F
MDAEQVITVLAGFPGTRIVEGNGDAFAIHNPDHDYEQPPGRAGRPWCGPT